MSKKFNWLMLVDVISLICLAIATAMVFFYAPLEMEMGAVQKVFYFHVAANWVGMLAFGASAIAGIVYLRTAQNKWDIASLAGVEIGMIFVFIGIVTGSIWARPIWNTWWTWDPRLTTVTIMELIYAAYLMLRQGIEDPERRARFGAVYVILGFASVPLTFISIRYFRTIHPIIIGGNDPSAVGTFNMTQPMLQTFIFSLITFTVIFVALFWRRIRLGLQSERIEKLKLELE